MDSSDCDTSNNEAGYHALDEEEASNSEGKASEEKEYATGKDKADDKTDDKRRLKRVIANRNSARASYQRRKRMVHDLQSEAADLSQMNAALMAENKRLRSQVHELKQQASSMLFLSSRSSQSGAGAAGGLGGTRSLGSSTGFLDSSMLKAMSGGMTDLGIMGLHQGGTQSLAPVAADGHHRHRTATAAAAALLSSSNTTPQHSFLSCMNLPDDGSYQQLHQNDSSALELQRALLTKQYLAQSLGLQPPPPPGGY